MEEKKQKMKNFPFLQLNKLAGMSETLFEKQDLQIS